MFYRVGYLCNRYVLEPNQTVHVFITVTGRLRRETCGSIHIALLKDMVKTQAGLNTSKQVMLNSNAKTGVG